ncbi:hypothetical protein F4781DRAFT_249368 [Annulohypoxylon bovei var. microspora]|nr:hypothetical protein F4781DRAFT_249368 [Annulohypoxylon bovei var. microspora]
MGYLTTLSKYRMTRRSHVYRAILAACNGRDISIRGFRGISTLSIRYLIIILIFLTEFNAASILKYLPTYYSLGTLGGATSWVTVTAYLLVVTLACDDSAVGRVSHTRTA